MAVVVHRVDPVGRAVYVRSYETISRSVAPRYALAENAVEARVEASDPMAIRHLADHIVRYVGPTNSLTGVVLDSASGASGLVRVFNEHKEAKIGVFETRLRTAAAAAATTITIPHLEPQPIKASDVLLIEDGKRWNSVVVSSVTPGTDETTPGTNFDTVVLASGLANAAAAGARVCLITKSLGSSILPITEGSEGIETGDVLEVETDTAGTLYSATAGRVDSVRATEDGELAKNQPSARALVFSSGTSIQASSHGRRVRVKLGGDLTMAQYGTALAGRDDWGWAATIPDTHPGIKLGQLLRVEINFNGGAGLADVATLIEPVVGG